MLLDDHENTLLNPRGQSNENLKYSFPLLTSSIFQTIAREKDEHTTGPRIKPLTM